MGNGLSAAPAAARSISWPIKSAHADAVKKGQPMDNKEIKLAVMEQYGKVAQGDATCGSLCGCTDNAEELAISFGYSASELATLPDGANLGVSCGNPHAVAALR